MWLFALGVLTLCVLSKGFRQVALISVAILGLAIADDVRRDHLRAARDAEQARIAHVKYASCDRIPYEVDTYLECEVRIDNATARAPSAPAPK